MLESIMLVAARRSSRAAGAPGRSTWCLLHRRAAGGRREYNFVPIGDPGIDELPGMSVFALEDGLSFPMEWGGARTSTRTRDRGDDVATIAHIAGVPVEELLPLLCTTAEGCPACASWSQDRPLSRRGPPDVATYVLKRGQGEMPSPIHGRALGGRSQPPSGRSPIQ